MSFKLLDVTDANGTTVQSGQEIDLVNNTITLRDRGGQLVQMDLGQADVHIDTALAGYAAGFALQEGVADYASPPVIVPHASDRYYTWDKDDTFQLVQDIAASPGSAVKEVSSRLSSTPFQTRQYALQAFVPTEVQANADAQINPQLAAMRRIMNAMMLAREIRVANLLRTSANHANVTTLTASTKWNGGTSSNPIQDLLTIVENSLQPITDIIMSPQAAHAFMQNAAVQKFIAYKPSIPGLPSANGTSTTGAGSLDAFTAILGLPPIRIAAMKYKATATTYPYIWGGDVLLLHKPPAGVPRDGQDIAASYTFRWNAADVVGGSTNTANNGGFTVRSFYNPYRGPRGGQQVVVTMNDIEVMTSTLVSGLIIGAFQ